jgi:hypothetical protein
LPRRALFYHPLWNLRPNLFHAHPKYLDGQNFDGETIRRMGIAFEMALASLGFTPGCDDPVRRTLAQGIIIGMAQVGERDPERLYEGALQAVSPAVQRDSPLPEG